MLEKNCQKKKRIDHCQRPVIINYKINTKKTNKFINIKAFCNLQIESCFYIKSSVAAICVQTTLTLHSADTTGH